MVFTHDTELALQAASVLVNSAEPPETLADVADLEQFVTDYAYSGRHDGDAAELRAVQALRGSLRDLLLAPRDEAVSIVNDLLSREHALPQLVRHEPHDWHVHAVSADAPLATRIAVETAMAMIDVIRADELSRLTVCDDADCAAVVLDLSRNRSRRFCSTTCGNRNAVAAYRARRAQR